MLRTTSPFLGDVVNNFTDVVDVTAEAEEIGIDKDSMFSSLLENAENSGAVKEVVVVASQIGSKSKDKLQNVYKC